MKSCSGIFYALFCFALIHGSSALQPQHFKSNIKQQLSSVFTNVAILSSVLTIIYAVPVQASNLENGQALFASSCAGCHAGGGNLFSRGQTLFSKDLVKNKMDNTEVMTAYILKGKGQMPAYGSFISPKGNVMPAKYTEDQIRDIADYILGEAASGWVPKSP